MIAIKTTIMAATIFMFATVASFADEQSSGPPSIPDLNQDSNLASEFSTWRTALQAFFDENGADYSVAYGIGSLDTTDKSSSRYVDSVTAAYKQALIDAYVRLSHQINPDGLNVTTSDDTTMKAAKGDFFRDSEIEKCRTEAYDTYQRQQRKTQEAQEASGSLLGAITARIRGDVPEKKDDQSKKEEKPEDFIHSCFVDGPSFTQEGIETTQIEDVLSGGRVWATVVHKDKLGLILVRSSETAEVASVLKNQLEPASINMQAIPELLERINTELAQYEGIPQGVVGTRMLRLSNREWAIYAYGAAQTIGQSGGGFMDSVMEGEDILNAQQEAVAELSRFSGLSIDFNRTKDELRQVKQRWRIDCNVTKDRCDRKMDEEQTFGAILNTAFSSSSELKLVGSETIFTKEFTDGQLHYYLTAQAWSPSIMAKNMNKRRVQDSAAENAARGGKYRGNEPAPAQVSTGKSKVIIFNKDW